MKKTTLIRLLAGFSCISIALTACGNKTETKPTPKVEPVVTEAPAEEEPAEREAVMMDKHMEAWNRNNDVVGWIFFPGDPRLSYPVLQGEDNDYYMDHDIDGNVCLSEGCITADYKLTFDGFNTSDNILLYGHNSVKNTFFAPLSNFHTRTLDYYQKNPIVEFDTMYEEGTWKIFATALFNTQEEFGEVFEYWEVTDFETADDFHHYVLNVMDRSALFTDVDLEYGDKLLTMHTCLYPLGRNVDSRVVVFARKVRDGESIEVDTSKAKLNPAPLAFGGKWGGLSWEKRTWDTDTYLKSFNQRRASTD